MSVDMLLDVDDSADLVDALAAHGWGDEGEPGAEQQPDRSGDAAADQQPEQGAADEVGQ